MAALVAALGGALVAATRDDNPPSSAQIATATEVSDLMVNELVAALFQEFGETTPQNVAQGKRAISLIFNDHNRDMRLIGSFGPLQGGENDRPNGTIEQTALARALAGGQVYTSVQKATPISRRSSSTPVATPGSG